MSDDDIAFKGNLNKRKVGTCTLEGCDRTTRRGYDWCRQHRRRLEFGITGDALIAPIGEIRSGIRVIRQDYCGFKDCKNPHYLKGFCGLHYHRAYAGRRMDGLPIPKRKEGERYSPFPGHLSRNGYRVVKDSITKRQIMVQRLVMEQSLGRDLLPA